MTDFGNEKGWSKKPGKQRAMLYTAPLHSLGKRLAAHLGKELRKELGRRALPLKVGDKVKVMRGSKNGAMGKITAVNRKGGVVFVEGITRKKADGKEIRIPLAPSNLMITEIERGDEMRVKTAKASKTSLTAEGKGAQAKHGEKKHAQAKKKIQAPESKKAGEKKKTAAKGAAKKKAKNG